MVSKVIFSSAKAEWSTPTHVYIDLDKEFHFDFDPCPLLDASESGMPLFNTDGLYKDWTGKRVFCNPPYGPGIGQWLAKAAEATIAVYLLPARTDTRWFHRFVLNAREIRFIKGRLKFGDAKNSAPFPSMIVIFKEIGEI